MLYLFQDLTGMKLIIDWLIDSSTFCISLKLCRTAKAYDFSKSIYRIYKKVL